MGFKALASGKLGGTMVLLRVRERKKSRINQNTEIKFPEGTPYIMPQAFSGCSSLEYVEIPSSVSWIGDLAFRGCTSLKHVNFHSNSTRINQNTFIGCTSLDCSNMSYRYNTAKSGDYRYNTTKSGCYIATCVYGSYDCPQVWTVCLCLFRLTPT